MTAPDVVIPAGTEYATAVGMLLKQIGPGGPYWRYMTQPTGVATPKLVYRQDSDWLNEAEILATSIGKHLVCLRDVWFVLDPNSVEHTEQSARQTRDRQLELELAFQMGYLRVDDMLDRISMAELAEWKDFLAHRKAA